ncbi:MAG: hypothetical protein ACOYLQ_09035 [Hyphomicrobiaceae bacterium]
MADDTDDDATKDEDYEVALALLRQAAALPPGIERDRLLALALKLDPDAAQPPPKALN